jgi:hypothetical protein
VDRAGAVNGGPLTLWFALLGCAVRRVGLLDATDGVALVSPEGGREPLTLVGEGPGRLRSLGAHLVEVTGRRAGRRVTVVSFRVLEGPSGFPVWFGPVQALGSQVALADPGSGNVLLVDRGAAEELRAYVGQWVAVEGYVEGPQQLRVLSFTVVE